jgi:hypothetical protein
VPHTVAVQVLELRVSAAHRITAVAKASRENPRAMLLAPAGR